MVLLIICSLAFSFASQEYDDLPADHRLHRCDLVDLSQQGVYKRGNLVGNGLPTFMCSSGSLYSRSRQQFLSATMMLEAMGVPCREAHVEEGMGWLSIDAASLSHGEAVSLAGNGMSVQCVGAVLMIVAVGVVPRS